MVLAGSLVYTGRVGGAGGLVEPGDAGAPLQLASSIIKMTVPIMERRDFIMNIAVLFLLV
jgi:hypothetical protein